MIPSTRNAFERQREMFFARARLSYAALFQCLSRNYIYLRIRTYVYVRVKDNFDRRNTINKRGERAVSPTRRTYTVKICQFIEIRYSPGRGYNVAIQTARSAGKRGIDIFFLTRLLFLFFLFFSIAQNTRGTPGQSNRLFIYRSLLARQRESETYTRDRIFLNEDNLNWIFSYYYDGRCNILIDRIDATMLFRGKKEKKNVLRSIIHVFADYLPRISVTVCRINYTFSFAETHEMRVLDGPGVAKWRAKLLNVETFRKNWEVSRRFPF